MSGSKTSVHDDLLTEELSLLIPYTYIPANINKNDHSSFFIHPKTMKNEMEDDNAQKLSLTALVSGYETLLEDIWHFSDACHA